MCGTSTFVRMLAVLSLTATLASHAAAAPRSHKLDGALARRASLATGRSRVIVRATAAARSGAVRAMLQQLGGTWTRALPIIDAHAADVPNAALAALSASHLVGRVSLDRVVTGAMDRTGAAVGATQMRDSLGYDGAGVGVAIVDSGVTSWHDDLGGAPDRAQRVERFVDLVGGREAPYDDHGHGTHVAGIIAGNGFDSGGSRSGIAPAADLVVLKVLDGSGEGRISNVIAALDYVVAHKTEHNIRVVNLSIAASTDESYESDPLALAARRAVSEGIVVVASAGNAGRSADGRTQYGGVMAPGNAPWVLTVGASSHMGTVDRADDAVAPFSSRGPAQGGYSAKPDLVAPGVGIASLSDPNSALYSTRSSSLLSGTVPTPYIPYLSLSGTSMSAPVVSGTVALMLQANPALTPNQVKAILQYTAQAYPGYDTLTQGAGFLNAKGAVELAHHLAQEAGHPFPDTSAWNRRLIWGNHLVEGGRLTPTANAWALSITWGAATTASGENIEWGLICSDTGCDGDAAPATPWDIATSRTENVVWGWQCGGQDCQQTWNPGTVLGTSEADTVVWGMTADDTVVWGMRCTDASCGPVIWSDR